ncbi:uptake hydrogenase HoxC (plasmid) [Afipia carboxidovorans OM5]|uniref:Uptake hydrogenase HoxC n=3 Tax=Afipia carboxidovorans TaxID=40137 RepID=Q6LB98_AFIC5|nr:uptake hydrogenase HoxC [Afipia carboxidovorans OM4]AEI08130.1 uptake hydrogenase HoxC [Afipia carboxidovorans OM5]
MTQVLTIGIQQIRGETRFSVSVRGTLFPTHLLVGRRCDDALRLMPLIFNLCPAAQGAAAAMAMGILPTTGTHTVIAYETLREHALVMLRDWPLALHDVPCNDDLSGLAGLCDSHLRDLEHTLFSTRATDVLDDFDGWLKNSQSRPAKYLKQVEKWPKSSGRTAAEFDPTFIGRVIQHPALSRIVDNEGITLFARMAARVVEAATLIIDITSGDAGIRYGRTDTSGGWAEAARGRLLHYARLRNGAIEDYRIETPTDSMIGDSAFLQNLLQSAATGPSAGRSDRIRIALTCADPCLPVIWQTRTKYDA